jgi:hypothetical protein
VLAATVPATGHAAVPAPPAVPVRVLQANVGNVNATPLGCGDQAVKLCLLPVEQRVIERLRALDPEVVLLQEVLPTLVCRPPARDGDVGTPPDSPSLSNPDHLCNPAMAERLAAEEQLDRLLPPAQWQTRCNDASLDPADPERTVPPWDCVGVRRDVGRLASFTSLPGTAPDAVPGETCDNGFTVNAAVLDVRGVAVQVTTAHPDSGPTRAGCRAEKLQRLLEALGGRTPPLPTVLSGDFNLDPYSGSDASTELWDRYVSLDGPTPYRYRSGIAEADPPPVTSNICGLSALDPTGQVLDGVQPPTPPCASVLDHVATTPDVTGACATLGEAPGTERLDGGGGTDHRAILCDLAVTATSDGEPQPVPAEPGAAPAPAGRALPATGGGPAVLGLLALLGALVARRTPRAR